MNTWDRQENEPQRWYSRFVTYRNMGPERTLLGAVNKSQKKSTRFLSGTWRDMAEQWHWKERAEAWDKHLQEEAEERAAAFRALEAQEIERIMTTDYAAKHKRVEALTEMAHLVESTFYGKNKESGKVELVPQWVTAEKLREWRGMLDDIAKELGHRVVKKELTGKDGGDITIRTTWGGGQLEDNE